MEIPIDPRPASSRKRLILIFITVLVILLSALLALSSSKEKKEFANEAGSQPDGSGHTENKRGADWLENQIACTKKISELSDLPLDKIREEISCRYLLDTYASVAPYFERINSVRCFDLNKDGKEETLLTIHVSDLNKIEGDRKDLEDLLVKKANAGAPAFDTFLAVFMERNGEDWNILWSDEFDGHEPKIEKGEQEDSLKVQDYHIKLDETFHLDIFGKFQDADENEIAADFTSNMSSNFGDYHTDRVVAAIDKPGDDTSYLTAARIWKREGNNYRFISDIPTGGYTDYGVGGDMDLMLLSSFTPATGNDILYLINVPGDSFCSLGLTKLDTATNKWAYPEFARSYRSCNPFVSPDGKKIATVDGAMDSISLYDLSTEKVIEVADISQDSRGLTLSRDYPNERAVKTSGGWLDSETFYFDIYEENDTLEQCEYIETRVWRIDGSAVKQIKTLDTNKEPLTS